MRRRLRMCVRRSVRQRAAFPASGARQTSLVMMKRGWRLKVSYRGLSRFVL
jgi:hypothetical protein